MSERCWGRATRHHGNISSWKCWTNCFKSRKGTGVKLLYRTESSLFENIKNYFSCWNNQQLCLQAGIHVVKLLFQESVLPINRTLPKLSQIKEFRACFSIKLLLKVKIHLALCSFYFFFKQQLNHFNDTQCHLSLGDRWTLSWEKVLPFAIYLSLQGGDKWPLIKRRDNYV